MKDKLQFNKWEIITLKELLDRLNMSSIYDGHPYDVEKRLDVINKVKDAERWL